MLCCTGSEESQEEFVRRVETCGQAELHELRLDLIAHPQKALEDLGPLFRRRKILVACRPSWEGGRYPGEEGARFELLRKAHESGAAIIDVELRSPPDLLATLMAGVGQDKILLSHHIFESGWDTDLLDSLVAEMALLKPGGLKLAVQVEDTADLAQLTKVDSSCFKGRHLVLTPMGSASIVGRARYPRLGTSWTYVVAAKDRATAEGQFTVQQAEAMGLPAQGPLVVLLGHRQVHDSFGPPTYNPLFRRAGLPHVYLPAETDRAGETLDLLEGFGLVGAAVTMPHKIAAFEWADRLDESARRAGAVNTLVRKGGGSEPDEKVWWGYNTDGEAVVASLAAACPVGPLKGLDVAILGAGGGARSAAESLARAGLRVTIFGRNRTRADRLASDLNLTVDSLDRLSLTSFDVLVNATPVGSDGKGLPLKDPSILAGKVVFDMVSHPVRTPLIREAKKAGARATIPGIEMWIRQGLRQLELWTGRVFTEQQVRDELARGGHLEGNEP